MISVSLCVDGSIASPSQQHAAARGLLQRCLTREFGLIGAQTRVRADARGRPCLARRLGLGVSLSHCAGAVAVAVADGAVGVDVEDVRAYDVHAARRVLHPIETTRIAEANDPDREFFRCWTLKESYGKALGVGLDYPLRSLRVTVSRDGTVTANRPDAVFRLDEGTGTFVLAVCCLRPESAVAGIRVARVEATRL